MVTKSSDCLPTQSCFDAFDAIYGNVTLDYALQKIADQNDVVLDVALEKLHKLKEFNHG